MPTFRNRLVRGSARLWTAPRAVEDRMRRLEWLMRITLPMAFAFPLQALSRILLGPTHQASIYASEIGLGGYLLGLALVVLANLGGRGAYQGDPPDPIPPADRAQ